MAYSSSIKYSQDILVCGLCESDTKIKVKCMDCDLYMCQKCVDKVHAKFKNADLHDIVALKDIHSHIDETDGNSDFKPVKCKDHRKQLCCMFCLTCELLVCPMCIAKTHHVHALVEIRAVCQMKVDEMKKMQNQAYSKIKKLIENLNLIGEIEKSKSREIEQKILKEEKQAREAQSQCLQQLKEHKEKTKRHSELMSKKEAEFLEEEKAIKMVIQQVENTHKSQDTLEFFEAVSNMHTKLDSIEESTSTNLFSMNIQRCVPYFKSQANYKSIEMEIQFKIKAKYEMDISDIHSIATDINGNIWITDGKRRIQQLQVEKDLKIKNSLVIEVIFNEIRCLNKELIFTSPDSPKIYLLAANGKLKIFKDLSPVVPFTLHVSVNEIIVGMNCCSAKDKTDIPVIIRFGFNGDIIKIYNNHQRHLLTKQIVRCCTTNDDGDICYLDSTLYGKYSADVVLINKDGNIQWKYRGNSFINSKEHPFKPAEVLSTKSLNFIVSDMDQHALHILSQLGELLTILDVTLIGLELPGVMTIDVHGTLWIESKRLKREILSPVKFSGF